ncbi:metalloprotease [Loigolactobacillus backii]|uniref:EF-P 5-aminopentanol modification-associated protein YfmF n=1 Tax=Loigolactobacillus backii TaxID=375175 RepID=UPI0007F16B27|nr:pitrilysin family protein [Loigolactobacillus backii]ANK64938.1 metalloprotease [Loigolactobacillus backii]
MIQTLTDGVTLNVIPSKQFKTIRIVLTFLAPLDNKTITKRSLLASLLETNSADYPTQTDLAAKLSAMYGANFGISVNKRGNAHFFTVTLTLTNDKFLPVQTGLLAEGLEFLKSVLYRPNIVDNAFEATTFQREKENMTAYLASVYDNKQAYASLKLQALYFKNDENQRVPSFGSQSVLDQIQPDELYQYYPKMLREDQILINVLGDVDESAVQEALADFSFAARQVPTTPLFYHQPTFEQIQEETQTQAVVQGKLNLAYQVPTYYYEPNYLPMLVTNGIFGGSPLALLFTNVREKASLAYYASSSYDAFRGIITVQTGIDSKNKTQVLDIVAKQLASVQAGDFSDDLIAKTKAMIINQYISGLDSTGYLTNQQLIQTLVPTSKIAIADFQQQIMAVTKQQIQALAKQIKLQAIYFLNGEGGQA